MKPETAAYLMLFCAFLLKKYSKVPLEDSLKLIPLSGGAKLLADEWKPKTNL